MPTFSVAPSNSGPTVYEVDDWEAATRMLAASLLGQPNQEGQFVDQMRRWLAGVSDPASSLVLTITFPDESSITYTYVEKVL